MDHLIVASRAAAELPERHLPLTQYEYGAVAAVLFVLMLVITFSFRSLWHRHDPSAYVPPAGSAHAAGAPRTGHGHGHGH